MWHPVLKTKFTTKLETCDNKADYEIEKLQSIKK